jgi:RNase P subunit RPR2
MTEELQNWIEIQDRIIEYKVDMSKHTDETNCQNCEKPIPIKTRRYTMTLEGSDGVKRIHEAICEECYPVLNKLALKKEIK